MGQLQEQFLKHFEQSQGIIRKVCAAYCYTPSDREDMFQDILVQAWKAFPQFRKEAAFSTWLYKIAICTAITANRKANPASTMESKYIDFSEMIDSDQEPKIESRDILRKSFQQLNPAERAMLLIWLEGYSYAETAELLGSTPGAVGVRLNRIKEHLRKFFTLN